MSAPLVAAARKLDDDAFSSLRRLALAEGGIIERDGLSLAFFGRAEVLELPTGLGDPARLAAIAARLDELAPEGAGALERPVAVGALPFLPDRPGALVVPELAVIRDGHDAVAVAVGRPEEVAGRLDSELERAARPARIGAVPDRFSLESAAPHEEFLTRVSAALAEIAGGRLDKVVLAREVVVEANRPFVQADLLERLRALHPSCTTFCLDGFLGATPELLVRRQGREVASDPLAGTAARSGDPEADARLEAALYSSAKERAEHRAVVDSISSRLAPVTERLEVPPGPEIVRLRNVSHLRTPISGRLAAPGGRVPTALELVALVHPTPAVAGSPVASALEYLEKNEHLDRDRYAGPVGFMRAGGDGAFYLGIRSALVEGASARLFAGVGVVADSEPAAELRETQLKLQAVLAAAVRP